MPLSGSAASSLARALAASLAPLASEVLSHANRIPVFDPQWAAASAAGGGGSCKRSWDGGGGCKRSQGGGGGGQT